MRFQYKHPKIYDLIIRLIYPKELMDKLSKEIGKNQSVFDVAAGYGRVAYYIDQSNSYHGIDLNEIFVNYGRDRGLDLQLKNILNESSYRESDIFVIVNVVHHLTQEKLKAMFNLIFKHALKKVIVVEPAFVDLSAKYGVIGKLIDWFLRIMDYDGFNVIHRWFTDKEYLALFDGRFGSDCADNFSVHQQKTANHYLVSFTKNN